MGREKIESLVTQSLMDRLIDSNDWPGTRSKSLALFRESLKRDLEWLLNSHRPRLPELSRYAQAANSVINYGMPDITSLYIDAQSDQHALLVMIQKALRTFEPRIANPRVAMMKTETVKRSIRFHIEGQLMLDPAPEDISFDTVLELTRGEYEVK